MKLAIDGRDVWAYTGGKGFDPTLPCVVLVHGALHDHSVWGLQSRYLAHHGRSVLAVDLPGHGRSAGPALASVEAAAGWLTALLDAAGVERATLAGHSMGSLMALEAAASLGDRARALMMVGTACPMRVSAALLETAGHDPLRAIDQVNAYSHSSHGAKPSAPAPGFSLHGGNKALMRRIQRGYAEAGHGNLFHHDFKICDSYARGLQAAAERRCPALLVLGAHDQMTPPRAASALAAALQAEVQTLAAGHALMSEAPDGVLQALLQVS